MEYFTWNIDPELLSIGSLSIRWYGVLFATSFLGGFYIMRWIYLRENKKVEELDKLLWYMMLGTIIGARLGHTFFYDPEYYFSNPLKIFAIWEGGLASHGGVAGILLALYIYCRKAKESYLWMLDRMAIPSGLGAMFIRLGNFFNSEIIGKQTDVPWAIVFERVDQLPRHPSQLYESLSYAITFVVTLWLYHKFGQQKRHGLIFGIFIMMIFGSRFFLEIFKTQQAAYSLGMNLSVGQLLSVPFVAGGAYLVFKALKQGK